MKKFFCVKAKLYEANQDFDIVRPASLNNPRNNSVMFICEEFIEKVSAFKSVENCLIFFPENVQPPAFIDSSNILKLVKNPHLAYCNFFKDNNITNNPEIENMKMINGSYISEEAQIGMNSTVMPMCYIGKDVIIGNDVYIGSGAKIVGEVAIGNNVVIRENAVLGADGLSTDRDSFGRAITMPQFGGIVIEDDVQIGANTVIARGAIDNTVLHKGTKIDNSSFISHNTVLGENTFVVGETIMFGSSSTGKNVLISGNCSLRNGVEIGDNSIVGMGSVVTKSFPKDSLILGNPAKNKGNRQ